MAAENDVLAILLTDQHHRWRTDAPDKVEDYLERFPDLASDPDIKLQLTVGDFQARQAMHTDPDIDEYTSRFSDISEELRSKLSELASDDSGEKDRFTTTATFIADRTLGGEQLGRYRLERVLGEGAFGRVYLAYDEERQRQVASKVPPSGTCTSPCFISWDATTTS